VKVRNHLEGLGVDESKIFKWKIKYRIRGMGLNHLALKRGQLWTLVNTVMNFLVKCSGHFLDEVSTVQLHAVEL
jgi:hypothetical protein